MLKFDPLLKLPSGEKSQNKFKEILQRFLGFNKKINQWVGMYALAAVNANIVRKSNAFLNYGENVIYKEA